MAQVNQPLLLVKRWSARAALALVAGAGVALVAGARTGGLFEARAGGQDLRKFNQLVQTSNSPSMRLLREGRDLLDGEEWAKAADKFREFVRAYPKERDVDAALYWLAYALKHEGKPREAAEPLTRLLREFPQSNWAEEATAMLTELAPQTGDRRLIDESLSRDNEEIRIVALQSLFESNPERAMAYVAEVLKPGSTASRGFKEAAVSMLGSHGGRQAVPLLLDIARRQTDAELRVVAIRRLADEGGESVAPDLAALYDAERDAEVKAHILRAFEQVSGAGARAKLLEVARNASERLELRQTAVRILGEREDGSAIADLESLYQSDTNREIREQIIRTLADMDDPRAFAKLVELARNPSGDHGLRESAIRKLGDRPGEASVEELFRIYDAESDRRLKEAALRALGDHESPRARARLVEIARARGGDRELRRQAIRTLADHDEGGGSAEVLVQLYDAEADREVKADILRALGNTQSKAALRKLLDVARRDPDLELRKRAISLLGESDDPEATRFLEDLLKP